jgi:hypothetical protein
MHEDIKKLALVGSAPSSRTLAPFQDKSWFIWACSPPNADLPRIDLWFELHGDLGWPENADWAAPYLQWLNSRPFPVFAQDQSYIPRAWTFPYQDLIARFSERFFTSTFAWQIAYALTKPNIKEIALYGIDMATQDEWARQKPHFHHFLDLATRAGIKITAPHESDILQPAPLYGYYESTAMGRKIAVRKLELEQRVAENRRMEKDAQSNLQHLFGALENMNYYSSVWAGHRVEKIVKPANAPDIIVAPTPPSDGTQLPASIREAQAAEAAAKANGTVPALTSPLSKNPTVDLGA